MDPLRYTWYSLDRARVPQIVTGAIPGAVAEIDVARERKRTSLTAVGAAEHHLNAAGAALPTSTTVAAVCDHLALEAAIGGYEAAAAARTRLDAVYAAAADLIGADGDDIALVESATVGWRRVIDAMRLGAGDRVLATRSTYVSSALQLLELERAGVVVELVPDGPAGHVDLEALERALGEPAALLVATHVPTSSGRVEPIAAIGGLAGEAGVSYLLDATQSVGQLPIDVAAVGCDALVTTGRKFLRGPRGTGFLYVSPRLRAGLRPAAPDVRGARWSGAHEFVLTDTARRFETWEAAHALRLGLGVALVEARAIGVEAVAAHVTALAAELRERLREEVAGIRIADPEDAASGIVTFVREGEDPQRTQETLARAGCHTVVVPASHGLWEMAPRGLRGVVRASFHVYNGEDDVEAAVAALGEAGDAGRPAPAARASAVRERFDAVVVGAGVHGRSAALQLARRERSVLLLEQGRIGTASGASNDVARTIRRACASSAWGDLVDLAYRGWAELETVASSPLLIVTGGLFAHPAGAEECLRGPGCETLDAASARRLAPALRLGEELSIVHDPAAGAIDAAAAMAALLEQGRAAGVELREGSPLLAWSEDDDGVVVETPGGAVRAERLVLCAGARTGLLAPELAPALRVTRTVNLELRPEDPAAVAPPRLGVFSVQVPDAGRFHGAPAVAGGGLTVSAESGSEEDPARPAPPVAESEVAALIELVQRFVPDGEGPIAAAIATRRTIAPPNRLAIGPLPGAPRVLVGAVCSDQGFELAPAVGEALADLALGVERPDLGFLAPAELAAPA